MKRQEDIRKNGEKISGVLQARFLVSRHGRSNSGAGTNEDDCNGSDRAAG